MILSQALSQTKLIVAGVSILATLGVFTWFYYQGKQEAREECLAEQAEVIQLWQEKIEQAEIENRELARDLAVTISDLEKAKSARTKRIIKYVESDPDSNTVIFDADGLSILNDAQQGITSPNQ